MNSTINEMTAEQYKAFEDRVRARARRQGLRLAKSHSRTREAFEFGTYMLVDVATNFAVAYGSGNGYGLSLEEIAAQLDA